LLNQLTEINFNNFKAYSELKNQITINFPHRGIFQLNDIKIITSDPIDLIKLRSKKPINKVFKIYPETYNVNLNINNLNIYTAGDQFNHNTNIRVGDLYDFKPYEKGEKLNRINWKMFSRSDELYSKIEEQSVTISNQIEFILFLNKTDDILAGKAVYIIKKLLNDYNKINISNFSLTNSKQNKDIRAAIIENVFSLETTISKFKNNFHKHKLSQSSPYSLFLIINKSNLENIYRYDANILNKFIIFTDSKSKYNNLKTIQI